MEYMEMYNTNAQDMFSSDYRVYIEGIQVPFESANISNIYGQLPTATVTIPPWPGMPELGRNYMPKINIFWRDYNFGVTSGELTDLGDGKVDAQRDAYKVIFSGVISATSDSKEIGSDSGNQSITFNCVHALTCMNDILIRYGNQAIQAAQSQLADNLDSTPTIAEWDINTMMIKALLGIKEGEEVTSAHYVEASKLAELQGTPGMLRVMWNVLKRDAMRKRGLGSSEVLTKLYIPLIEEGLEFWERMTGHLGIESGIEDDTSRIDYNNGTDNSVIHGVTDISGKIMVPSVFRSFLGEAAQKELALTAMQSLQAGVGSPEKASFMDHIEALLRRLEYDMVTLSSPVSIGDDGSRMYEYIVKPILPTYYAPICNVVLPNMLSSISVSNNYEMIPSRTVNLTNLVALVTGLSSGPYPDQAYASPHSVRYARAGGESGDLAESLYTRNNIPGKYEYGSGVRAKTTRLPALYNLMRVSLDKKEVGKGSDTSVNGAVGLAAASSAWEKMYPESKWPGAAKYNPLGSESGITSFNRLNFVYSDQQFAMETAKARTAQVAGIFNPYAVVGYPMDVVDSVPSRESYHGMCTSVSHSIHASGHASTSYGLASVSTFTELALYNIPAVNPYLNSVFEFQTDSRIYSNSKAYKKACSIYSGVFGVGAAEPAILQDYGTGSPIPFTRSGGFWVNGTDEYLKTVQGSLMLVARNITSLLEMDTARAKKGLSKFVDIADWHDTELSDVTVVDSATSVKMSKDRTKIETLGKDTESSPFLDYNEAPDEE